MATSTRNKPVELAPGLFFSFPASLASNAAFLALVREGYDHPDAAQGAPPPRTPYHEASDKELVADPPQSLADRFEATARLMAFSLGYSVRRDQALGLLVSEPRPDGKVFLKRRRSLRGKKIV